MLFRWEKHGAPVRRDFSYMMQKGRGRIGFCHGRCFRAQFALKGAHASPSLLAHAAGRSRVPAKTPRAASCLLMGSRPQWPPFGAKPRSCKYSYGVSPGFPPGSFYPPATQRSGKGEDDTMYFNLYYSYIIFLYACQHSFQKERPPSGARRRRGGGCGFWPAPG